MDGEVETGDKVSRKRWLENYGRITLLMLEPSRALWFKHGDSNTPETLNTLEIICFSFSFPQKGM